VTLASRERQVLLEPRGVGLLMSTLRSAHEVRTAEFAIHNTDAIDPDMLAIAETIIERAKGKFDPADFHDSYQEALHALVEDKLKGIATKPRAVAAPPKVIDLMEALKRSLGTMPPQAKAKRQRSADRSQPQLLMPAGVAKRESQSRGPNRPPPPPRLLAARKLDRAMDNDFVELAVIAPVAVVKRIERSQIASCALGITDPTRVIVRLTNGIALVVTRASFEGTGLATGIGIPLV
jgi:hypothetical protein